MLMPWSSLDIPHTCVGETCAHTVMAHETIIHTTHVCHGWVRTRASIAWYKLEAKGTWSAGVTTEALQPTSCVVESSVSAAVVGDCEACNTANGYQ
jgi:hypothetical protein